MPNSGQFKPGPDARRHKFTAEECSKGGSQPTCHRLTAEHRIAGGHAAWQRYMAQHRIEQGLPVPVHLAGWAKKVLEEKQRKDGAA